MKVFFLLVSLIFAKEVEIQVDDKKTTNVNNNSSVSCFDDKGNTLQICNNSLTKTSDNKTDDNKTNKTSSTCIDSCTKSTPTKTNDDKTYFTSKDYINSSNEILHDELFFTFFTFFMFLF